MTDARSLADDAVHHLDRLAAAILDDVGDGPAPAVFAGIAADVQIAIGKVGVPAFTEVTGLVSRIADSLLAGTADWSPSLGGTLMASLDDLRTLVLRAAEFSAEDGEHLHHRASELAVYAHGSRQGEHPAASAPSTADVPSRVSAQPTMSPAAVVDQPAPTESTTPAPSPGPSPSVVPIASLFFSDGPQVVSGGVPKAAGARSDLLGAAVDALDALSNERLAAPSSTGPMTVVPVETLVYRGRAALERAAAIREQIKASGTNASPAALDEMYDLIGLALKD